MAGKETDNNRSLTTGFRSGLETIQPAVTIAIAILGGWLSFEQSQIKKTQDDIANQLGQQRQQHDERIQITVQSAQLLERAKDYLLALKLDDEKNDRVLISLLAIETDIRMSLTGEINEAGVREKVDVLPLHLALLANDSESLAHIGGGPQDLDRWLPIAEASGDITVRRVAIDALMKIGELSNDADVIEKCVDAITKLTQRWNNAELRTKGAGAIRRLAEVHAKSEIDNSQQLSNRIVDALRELEGATTLSVSSTDGIAAGARDTASEIAQSEQEQEQAEQRDAIRNLLDQYQARTDLAPEAKTLSTLIMDLESGETATRRVARSKISEHGVEAVGLLLQALVDSPSNYRVRVGVVTSLMLMPQPLALNSDQIDAIVPLLGDPDKTVRTNTAQFLGSLTDPTTLTATIEALRTIATKAENYENGNYIFNCVIVFVDWLKWNDYVKSSAEHIGQIGVSLREIDSNLEEDRRGWDSTRKRIEDALDIIES